MMQQVPISLLCHPAGAGQMTVVDEPRALWLAFGVEPEQRPNDLSPVGAFFVGIEQMDIGLEMALVVGGNMGRIRRAIIKRNNGHGQNLRAKSTGIFRLTALLSPAHDSNSTINSSLGLCLAWSGGRSRLAPCVSAIFQEAARISLSSILRSGIPFKANTLPMQIREVFARNLRRQRHAKGLSQEALAHEAGIDRTYVSSLERCVYSASIDTVAMLAKVLDVEPDELLRRGVRPPARTKR